jgi:hypothetical protein
MMAKANPDQIRRDDAAQARERYLARVDVGACCVCGSARDPGSRLLCRACIDDSIARSRVILLQAVALGDQRRAREATWVQIDPNDA